MHISRQLKINYALKDINHKSKLNYFKATRCISWQNRPLNKDKPLKYSI